MARCHKRAFVTTQPGRVIQRLIHMNRSGADQQLVRKPPSSGVTDGAGWQENVSNLPSTRSTCILVLEESIFLQRSGARQTAVHWVSAGRVKARVGALIHYRSRTVAWANKPVSCK